MPAARDAAPAPGPVPVTGPAAGVRAPSPDRPPAAAAVSGRRVLVVGLDHAPGTVAPGTGAADVAEHLATSAASVTVLTGLPRHADGRVPTAYRRGLRVAEAAWHSPDAPSVVRLRHYRPRRRGRVRQALHETVAALAVRFGARGLRFDLVVALTPSAGAAAGAVRLARRCGVPSVVIVAGRVPGSPSANAFERHALRHATEVSLASEGFRPAAVAAGVPAERLHLLPAWSRVRAGTESRLVAREALGWPVDRFTVVHAGPLDHRQDLVALVEAARVLDRRSAQAPGAARHAPGSAPARYGDALAAWDRQVLAGAVDVVLLGDGPQRAGLEQLAFGLPNVRFRGGDDGDLVPLALRAADVLVISDRSGPVAHSVDGRTAAYLGAGRPVVAATAEDSPVAHELRRAGSAGLVVPPGDVEGIADALLSLQADPRRRAAMSRAALRYARAHLGRAAFLRRLDLVLASALPGPDPSAAGTGEA